MLLHLILTRMEPQIKPSKEKLVELGHSRYKMAGVPASNPTPSSSFLPGFLALETKSKPRRHDSSCESVRT